MPESKPPTIFVGMPVGSTTEVATQQCVHELMAGCGFNLIMGMKAYCLVHAARNALVEMFLKEKDASHLLFIDSDTTFQPSALRTLYDDDVDIVSGLSVKRSMPCEPTGGLKMEGSEVLAGFLTGFEKFDGPVEMEAVGMAFTLIKREVFETMEKPWFYSKYLPGLKDLMSEDWSFCMNAKKAGFKVFMDTSVILGHIGKYIYTVKEFLSMRHKTKWTVAGKRYYPKFDDKYDRAWLDKEVEALRRYE